MPFPAAAGDGLHHHRKPDLPGALNDHRIRYVGGKWLFGAGHDGHARSNRRTPCCGLAAHQRNRLSGRTDEREPRVAARGGKVLVL
jgi:hypothetical protein